MVVAAPFYTTIKKLLLFFIPNVAIKLSPLHCYGNCVLVVGGGDIVVVVVIITLVGLRSKNCR